LKAHDIAGDMVDAGMEVTMVQRAETGSSNNTKSLNLNP